MVRAIRKSAEGKLADWLNNNETYVQQSRQLNPNIENEDEDEDYLHDIPEGNLKDWSEEGEFDIKGIVKDAFDDIDQIVLFLSKMDDITPESDNKIVELVKILNSEQMTSNGKVIIFGVHDSRSLH